MNRLYVILFFGVLVLATVGWSIGKLLIGSNEATSPTSARANAQGGPPALPSSFYGAAQLNGDDAAPGTVVTAFIGGATYAEGTVSMYQGRPIYAINVPADDPATAAVEGGKPGDIVVFAVGGVAAAQTASWRSGGNLKVDLAAARP